MELKLPLTVVDRHDVSRMVREIEALNEFMLQTRLRKPGEGVQMPRLSRILEETTTLNQLNLVNDPDRRKLLDGLKFVAEKAPIFHMSFAVEPSAVVSSRLVEWFRNQIHPQMLVKFGLQPTIAAGCTMRTVSKYYDMSLRRTLQKQSFKLIELIKSDNPAQAAEAMGRQPRMATTVTDVPPVSATVQLTSEKTSTAPAQAAPASPPVSPSPTPVQPVPSSAAPSPSVQPSARPLTMQPVTRPIEPPVNRAFQTPPVPIVQDVTPVPAAAPAPPPTGLQLPRPAAQPSQSIQAQSSQQSQPIPQERQ